MEKNIVRGPVDDWPPLNCPLGERFLKTLRSLGDRIIQVYPDLDKEISARWILDRAAAEAEILDVSSGEVVVVVTTCDPHFAPIMLAILCKGAVCAPLNPKLDTEELSRLLQTLSPAVVLSSPEHLEAVAKAWGGRRPRLLGAAAPTTSQLQQRPLGELRRRPALLMCSSGTTGRSKSVILSQDNINSLLHYMMRKDEPWRKCNTILAHSPTYWISGILFQITTLETGSKLVFPQVYSEERFLFYVERYQPDMVFLAPNQFVVQEKYPGTSREKLSCIKYALTGGSALETSTQRHLQESLGLSLWQCYGMTEILLVCGRNETRAPPVGSVGWVSPYNQAKVVDTDTGEALGPNCEGELCFRGLFTCLGYVSMEPIPDNAWFHTGDVGYYDSNGAFYVVDRIKELIKFRGNHVSPSEIEAVLLSHDDVLEAVVVGVPHPEDQEHPTGFIVRRPGSTVTCDQLIKYVADNFANPDKHLRGGVFFLSEIPKSPTGKPRRSEVLSNCLSKKINYTA